MMTQNHRAAAFWTLLAQVAFVVTWTAIKLIGDRLPLFEVVFFRGVLSSLILLPLILHRHTPIIGEHTSFLLLRSLLGFFGMALGFYSLMHMEMGNAVTLFNTMPIFVVLLAPLLLKEPFRKRQLAFVLTAFCGIVLIMRPDVRIFGPAAVYALIAGVASSLATICTRKIGGSESVLVMALYFGAFAAFASAPFALTAFMWPTQREWMMLALVGVSVSCGQVFSIRAFQKGQASFIAPFNYISVVGSYVAGVLVFSELPSFYSAVGAAIVIASGVGIILTMPRAALVKETPY